MRSREAAEAQVTQQRNLSLGWLQDQGSSLWTSFAVVALGALIHMLWVWPAWSSDRLCEHGLTEGANDPLMRKAESQTALLVSACIWQLTG